MNCPEQRWRNGPAAGAGICMSSLRKASLGNRAQETAPASIPEHTTEHKVHGDRVRLGHSWSTDEMSI